MAPIPRVHGVMAPPLPGGGKKGGAGQEVRCIERIARNEHFVVDVVRPGRAHVHIGTNRDPGSGLRPQRCWNEEHTTPARHDSSLVREDYLSNALTRGRLGSDPKLHRLTGQRLGDRPNAWTAADRNAVTA